MKKNIVILMSVVMAFCSLAGCGKDKTAPKESVVQERSLQTPSVADPDGALTEIYSEIDIKGITSATDSVLEDKFAMDLEYVDQYWVKYSSKNYGVSDVFIIKPIDGGNEKVEEMLDSIKKQRINEFTDYDVYNSLQISKDAVVYTHGDYIILLMLEDNARGKEIISSYIPS